MVVNCPNCECPNDADVDRCRQCGARIPWALRERAMVPKAPPQQQASRNYADGDSVARESQRQVVRMTGDDMVGRRTDARSLRGELQPRESHISSTSDVKYAPPPTHATAARSDSGRQLVDQQAYQQSLGRGPAAPPAYTDPAAWQAQHGAAPHSRAQTQQAASAAAVTDPGAALSAHQANVPAAPRGQMPPAPSFGVPSGTPQAPTQAQAAHWQAGQLSVPTEAETARALAASAASDPMAALGQASQRAMPPLPGMAPPPQQYAAPQPQFAASPQGYAPAPQQAYAAPQQGYPPAGYPGQPAAPAPGYPQASQGGYGPPAPGHATAPPQQAYAAYAPAAPAPPQIELPKPISGESQIRGRDEPAPEPKAAPAPANETVLIFLDDDGKKRERLPLRPGKTYIGRSEGEVLLTKDPYVSPWHAQLTMRRDAVVIKDMYSLNGIYKRISRQAVLRDGDKCIIGRQVVQFRLGWHQAAPDAQETRPLGGPPPSTPARVLVLTESGEVADLRLIRETLIIGRSGCDVNIPEDDRMSDKHVQIQRHGDTYLLIDLNSGDGVYLAIRGECEMEDGDVIQIGRQRLMLERPS